MENKKMNKKEFARTLAQKTGLTIKDIEEVEMCVAAKGFSLL